jgi:hypothetical protein
LTDKFDAMLKENSHFDKVNARLDAVLKAVEQAGRREGPQLETPPKPSAPRASATTRTQQPADKKG